MRYLISLVLLLGIVSFCMGQQDSPEEAMVHSRAHHLALRAFELYEFPVEHRPTIVWNYMDDWEHAAIADCKGWQLILNHRTAIDNTDAMLNKVLPHEYGHFVYCHLHNGTVGRDAHSLQWQFYVAELGGDPTYY